MIIIIVYVLSVFLARWLNKKLIEIDGFYNISPWGWFVPVLNVLFSLIPILIELNNKSSSKSNWFTGKYWK